MHLVTATGTVSPIYRAILRLLASWVDATSRLSLPDHVSITDTRTAVTVMTTSGALAQHLLDGLSSGLRRGDMASVDPAAAVWAGDFPISLTLVRS